MITVDCGDQELEQGGVGPFTDGNYCLEFWMNDCFVDSRNRAEDGLPMLPWTITVHHEGVWGRER
jgi:hypothetical protein